MDLDQPYSWLGVRGQSHFSVRRLTICTSVHTAWTRAIASKLHKLQVFQLQVISQL